MRITTLRTVQRFKIGHLTTSVFNETDGYSFRAEPFGVVVTLPGEKPAYELVPWSQIGPSPIDISDGVAPAAKEPKGKAA